MSLPGPPEADWDHAPPLVEGALGLDLSPQKCDLEYWLRAVGQDVVREHVHGHRPETAVPPHMLEDGPLRRAAIREFAFRAMVEEVATRMITYLVRTAPSRETMDFYASQLMDEARHADIFRWHLRELGIAKHEIGDVLEREAGTWHDRIVWPMAEFALDEGKGGEDFIIGVVVLTVLVEGALAAAVELAEHKWRVFDPAGAEAARSTNIDELRHLNVGAAIVRQHVEQSPSEKTRIAAVIERGFAKWARDLPIGELLLERETLFQRGLEKHAVLAGAYELAPGRKLVATTIEERLAMAERQAEAFRDARLAAMLR